MIPYLTPAQRYANYKGYFLRQQFKESELMPFDKWQKWTDRIPDAVITNADFILMNGKTKRRRREHKSRAANL